MAAKKKNPLNRAPQDEGEAKLLANVKDPGWHVIGVMESEEGPAFVYTIGLYHNFRHPEIIALGLDVPILWQIVNVIGDKVKEGAKFEDKHEADGILEGYLVFFRRMEKRHYREYLGYARWFYEGDEFPTLQCVWPDKSRRYPWHPEASEQFRQRQPFLYDPASWRFQEGRNRAVFTTKPVIHDGLPILLVSHDTEGDWQFLCGTTDKVDDAAVVSLGEILKRDQTLADLADLPEGWQASREEGGGVWKRKKEANEK
jgi:hypothetical protein